MSMAVRYFKEHQVAFCERFSDWLLPCGCCLSERNNFENAGNVFEELYYIQYGKFLKSIISTKVMEVVRNFDLLVF